MIEKKKPETPLTDSFMASAPPGAKPLVAKLTWPDGFVLGIGAYDDTGNEVRVVHFKPVLEKDGKRWPWGVEIIRRTPADGKEHVELIGRRLFTTEKAAEAEAGRRVAKMRALDAQREASKPKPQTHQPTSDEQDLANARLKVMRTECPDTFKALDAWAQAKPEDQAEAMEEVFRGWLKDLCRLQKPDKLPEGIQLPNDVNFFMELAKAYKAKSPYDSVNWEIAAKWHAAGYNKMSLKEYTKVINSKAKSTLKSKTMEKRRYSKLGLMTDKPVGPPPKE
jgi:hypothetical protein